jgi:hypothetical protein
MIILSSSWRTKFSPRSINFNWPVSWSTSLAVAFSRWRRLVCCNMFSCGDWFAELNGKVRITKCKMTNDGYSLSAVRALTRLKSPNNGISVILDAWQCSVGLETIVSIVRLVEQWLESRIMNFTNLVILGHFTSTISVFSIKTKHDGFVFSIQTVNVSLMSEHQFCPSRLRIYLSYSYFANWRLVLWSVWHTRSYFAGHLIFISGICVCESVNLISYRVLFGLNDFE